MPEPLRYLQAASAAALAAFLWSLTLRWLERRRLARAASLAQQRAPAPTPKVSAATTNGVDSLPAPPDRRRPLEWTWRGMPWLGVLIGIVAGCAVLGLRPTLPPRNALDRLLVVLIPLAAIVEGCGAFGLAGRRSLSLLRTCVALLLPGTLLFGSVYLRASDDGWSWPRTLAIFMLLSGGLAGLRWLLTCLAERTSRGTVELSLGMTIQATGLLIMLAGYLKGGAASFALASPLLGVGAASIVARRTTARPETTGDDGESIEAARTAYLGAVLLIGLAVIGRFFGGLTSTAAVFACLAPLGGWVIALAFPARATTRAGRAFQAAIQLAAVALPLLLLLMQGKATFDRKMGPLLKSQQPSGRAAP